MLFFLLLLPLVLSQANSNFDVELRTLYENEMSCVVSLYNIDPLNIEFLQCTFKTTDNKLKTEQCELFTQEYKDHAVLVSTVPKGSYLLESVSLNLYNGEKIVKEFFMDLDSVSSFEERDTGTIVEVTVEPYQVNVVNGNQSITLYVNISGRSEDDDSPIEFFLASSMGTALTVNTTVFPYVYENGLYKINMHIPRWSPYGYYYASLTKFYGPLVSQTPIMNVTSIMDRRIPRLNYIVFQPLTINASFEEALFTVAFNVTDDVSGVNFESAHFETDRVNSATDCYNRTIYGGDFVSFTCRFPCCYETSNYSIIDMSVTDNYGRVARRIMDDYYPGNRMLVISVNDTVDPDLVDIIVPKSVDVFTFINFTIVMRLTDNASGPDPIAVEVEFDSQRETCKGLKFIRGSGARKNGTKYDGYYNFFVAGIPYCKTGNHSFQSISIYDRRGNVRFYDSSELESLGLQRTIYVRTNEDFISPVIHSFTVDTNETLPIVSVQVSDELSGLSPKANYSYGYLPYQFYENLSLFPAGTIGIRTLNIASNYSLGNPINGSTSFLYFYDIIVPDNSGNLVTIDQLVFPLPGAPSCTPDAYEPNRLGGRATPLNYPAKVDGNFCETSDDDYYSFHFDEPKNITVMVTSTDLKYIQVTMMISNVSAELFAIESAQLKFTREVVGDVYFVVVTVKPDNPMLTSYSMFVHNCTVTCSSFRVLNVHNCLCEFPASTTGLETSPNEEVQNLVNNSGNNSQVTTIVGSVLGVVVGLGIIALIIFLVYRKRKTDKDNEKAAIELGNATNEPHNVSDVVITGQIGAGNFSEVYKGTMQGSVPVALKRLKNIEAYHEFVKEQKILQSLQHKNIVHFYGTYFDPKMKDHYLVLEYLSQGSALSLLQKLGEKLSILDLTAMAKDCAAGMLYLSENKIVHRDLAARNLLVTESATGPEKYVAKVTDFGLSKAVETASYYKSDNTQMPIKWSAPESLQYGKFSTASDVWSYGITLWEIFSYGKMPYDNISNIKASEMIKKGETLQRPAACPDALWTIMERCWIRDPAQRISFSEIVELTHQFYVQCVVQNNK